MERFYEKYIIREGTKVDLSKFDPDDTLEFKDKAAGLALLEKNNHRIARLQTDLYSEGKQSLLIVLQALDAGGKDGTINNVFSAMNPQGCRVQSFKTPTALEQAHDFLWRAHPVVPRRGEVVIFNRSYYEAVLVERVHKFASSEELDYRYKAINNFEDLLVHNRTRIVKFYLHISKDEQLRRFVRRLKRPEKHWKISSNDYHERQFWDNYIEAFEVALSRCSTKEAPWFVVPGNTKWFRNLVVSQILLETLESMKIELPAPSVDLQEPRRLAAIELARKQGAFVFGICNSVGASIPRATHTGAYIHVGPEIGVASTKAFTGQVTVLAMLTLALAKARGTISQDEYVKMVRELVAIPEKMKEALQANEQIAQMAKIFTYAHNCLYLGRGYCYPVALEGALKLKEISYIHAEGYPAAEMKHGPIALIDSEMPVFVIATRNGMYEKLISNIQEVKARQGRVIALVTKGDTKIRELADEVIELPETMECFDPLVVSVPLQLLAYHIAVCKGKDVDQPRNLAKSVTVE